MHITIKTVKDLENTIGKSLAKAFRNIAKDRGGMRRVPSSVSFHTTKPAFYLNDGSTLTAYAVDLVEGKIVGERYCGSSDTAINHLEQFAVGYSSPENYALVFLTTDWNGVNTSWCLDVVTTNVQLFFKGN